jgi:transcription elongation GreA/GreB family factor
LDPDLSARPFAAQHVDMSRAFVKETDGDDGEPLVELKVSPHRNLVTREGRVQIDATVERLRSELSAAREAEDRARARRIQRDLRYWVERQRTAELVPPAPPGAKVRFGSTVTLRRDAGGTVQYRIVGEDEAGPGEGRISWVSPLAKRLIGAEAGDAVDLPDGPATISGVE